MVWPLLLGLSARIAPYMPYMKGVTTAGGVAYGAYEIVNAKGANHNQDGALAALQNDVAGVKEVVSGIAHTQAQQTEILQRMAAAQVGQGGAAPAPAAPAAPAPVIPPSNIAPAPPALAVSFTQACVNSLTVQHQRLDPPSAQVTRTLDKTEKEGLCHTVVDGRFPGAEYKLNLGANFVCSVSNTTVEPSGMVTGRCTSVNAPKKEQVTFSAYVPSGAGAGPQ